MHSATDTFHGWPAYIDMIGGEFLTHGAQVEVDAINQDKECPACRHLAAQTGRFTTRFTSSRISIRPRSTGC